MAGGRAGPYYALDESLGRGLSGLARGVLGYGQIAPGGDGWWWALVDNGFGTKLNSSDAQLRVYRVRPTWRDAGGGEGSVEIDAVVVELSDPDRQLPFRITNEETTARILTAADLDPDRDRTEILDLIFLPGFTTSEQVTEISGRGVGMDVVKRNVSRLSGMIDIETEPGEGTVFTLTMPITLAIIKALIIETGGRRFAVPLGSVLESLRVRPDQIETVETREVMAIRDAGRAD